MKDERRRGRGNRRMASHTLNYVRCPQMYPWSTHSYVHIQLQICTIHGIHTMHTEMRMQVSLPLYSKWGFVITIRCWNLWGCVQTTQPLIELGLVQICIRLPNDSLSLSAKFKWFWNNHVCVCACAKWCKCAKVLKDTKTDNYFVVVSCLHKPRFNLWLNQNLFSICLKAINREYTSTKFCIGRHFRCKWSCRFLFWSHALSLSIAPFCRTHTHNTTCTTFFLFLIEFQVFVRFALYHSDFICLGNEFNANASQWYNCTSTIPPQMQYTANAVAADAAATLWFCPTIFQNTHTAPWCKLCVYLHN